MKKDKLYALLLSMLLFCGLGVQTAWANICNRTPQVRDAIMDELRRRTQEKWMTPTDCRDVKKLHLWSIRELNVNSAFTPEDLADLDNFGKSLHSRHQYGLPARKVGRLLQSQRSAHL